jgi:hypothetical protein
MMDEEEKPLATRQRSNSLPDFLPSEKEKKVVSFTQKNAFIFVSLMYIAIHIKT